MTHKRASRFEKMCRTYGIIFMFLIVGAVTIYNINLHSSAARTSDGAAEVVDCDSIIKKSSLFDGTNNLGSLGVFGAVAFGNIQGGSYRGGIATGNISGNAGIGGSGIQSINYVAEANNYSISEWDSNFSTNGTMFVAGKNLAMTIENGRYSIAGTGFDAWKVANGANLYKEEDQAFVSMSDLKTIAVELSQKLAGLGSTSNVAISGGGQSYQKADISSNGSDLAVFNMLARNDGWEAGYEISISNNQTLVINFDAKGKNTIQLGNFITNHNGQSNLVFNVFDSSKPDKQFTGNLDFGNGNKRVMIIAPSATVAGQNIDGIIIANNINVSNSTRRPFYGTFPLEADTKESFGVCDTGGEVPAGKHKLTMNHYIKGESEPFDKTFGEIEDGGSYDVEPVEVDYLTYSGVRSGAAHGDNITEDVTVDLDYTVNKIQFNIEYQSTEGGLIKYVKTPLISALDTYTVEPEKLEDYKFDHSSAALTQKMKDFGKSIVLYYRPWQDPAEVVTEDMVYEKTPYYVESNLSTLGGFHMVAFERIDANVRAYGNILTNRVDNMSEFSLVHFPLVSYMKVVGDNIKNPKFAPNDQVQTVLVVGENVDIDLADNGNRWLINGQKVDSPVRREGSEHTNLWREKDVKFVDLEGLEAQSKEFSKLLGSYDDITTEKDFSDMNNKKIIVGNQNGLNVINLTHEDFDDSHDIFVEGFDRDQKSTLVINIDMAGYTGDVFNFAGTRLRWDDGVYMEGSSANSANLDDVRLNNTITLNFIDSSSEDGLFHGTAQSSRPMLAFSLLPEGCFIIESSSYAGAVVAKRVSGHGNSYMVLFDHAFYQLVPDEPEPDPIIPESPKTDDNIMTFVLFGVICSALAALSVTEYLISLRKR